MNLLHAKRRAILLAVALFLALAGVARAESDPCREWAAEHHHWKKEVVGRYLSPVAQAELDEAVFDLIQREAYRTSCDGSARAARGDRVGWRFVGRLPDEFALAVVESVLESGGFDVSLQSLVGTPQVAARAR